MMASLSASQSKTYRIQLDGQWHELIVVIRSGDDKHNPTKLSEIAMATVGNWLRVWQAFYQKLDTDFEDHPSAIYKCEVQASTEDPYCTVQNSSETLTVHSNTLPGEALDVMKAQAILAIDIEKQFSSSAPEDSQVHDTPASLKAWVRRFQTSPQLISNWRSLEVQKNLFTSSARLMDIPYDYNETANEKRLYPITGMLKICQYENGTRYLHIQIGTGGTHHIAERDDPTTKDGKRIPSDWHRCLADMQLWDEELAAPYPDVQVGKSFVVSATHIVLKYTSKGFKNFGGFYREMEIMASEDAIEI